MGWERERATESPYDPRSRFSDGGDDIGIPQERMFLDAVRHPSFPKLRLGNLDAYRDWGHAEDYVEGMWRMLQQDKPDDYVLATGTSCSVRDFVGEVFGALGREIIWQGRGAEEVGMLLENNRKVVRIAPEFYRPAEVYNLIGDSRKAQQNLKWSIRKTRHNLIQDMIDAELHKHATAGGHTQRARA